MRIQRALGLHSDLASMKNLGLVIGLRFSSSYEGHDHRKTSQPGLVGDAAS